MATANPYNSGMKKPLNMLEVPVYADIKKGPPRFVWSKKFWNVDSGATMMSTEPFTQVIEHAVLAQSRDYNKTVYGQSSHRDIVNAEFRPPLISYYEDVGPLTRVPTKIHAIIPRLNPGTANETNTSGFAAKNDRPSSIEKSLTDRVKKGDTRPIFYAPMEVPIDNSVLPDLEIKIPATSLSSGWTFNYKAGLDQKEIELREKLSTVPMNPGLTSSIRITGRSDLEGYQAKQNIPSTSAFAGVELSSMPSNNNISHDIELVDKTPSYSVSSGYTHLPHTKIDHDYNLNLEYNNPQVSGYSGISAIENYNIETPINELDYKTPQVSAYSGEHYSFEHQNLQSPIDYDFEEKLSTPLFVTNPGTSEQSHIDLNSFSDIGEKYINQKHMNLSYEVSKEIPNYRERNILTKKTIVAEKLQPEKAGRYSQTGNSIPKFGIEIPQESYREKRNNKYIVNKKKPMYKI